MAKKSKSSKVLFGAAIAGLGVLLFSSFKKAGSNTSTVDFKKYPQVVTGKVRKNTTANNNGKIVNVPANTQVQVLGIYTSTMEYATNLGKIKKTDVFLLPTNTDIIISANTNNQTSA